MCPDVSTVLNIVLHVVISVCRTIYRVSNLRRDWLLL
jgi:hypothetical protein